MGSLSFVGLDPPNVALVFPFGFTLTRWLAAFWFFRVSWGFPFKGSQKKKIASAREATVKGSGAMNCRGSFGAAFGVVLCTQHIGNTLQIE